MLITAVGWFTYRSVGDHKFVLLDDDLHLAHNPHLKDSESLVGIWKEPYQGLYIPVTYTVWAAQKALFNRYWGTWEPGVAPRESSARLFHWTNWALHVANTFLVFLILMELLGGAATPWAALSGALLFCLHPVQVEPIAWISGLKDVLSGFFGLLAVLGYLRSSRAQREKLPGQWIAYGWATFAYLLALLSKPSTVAIPLIALALDCLGRRAPFRASALRLLPWMLAALPLAWFAKVNQPSIHMSYVAPFFSRPLIASDALTFYFSKVIVPIGLAPDYGRHPLRFLTSNWRWVTWCVPILMVFVLRKRARSTQMAFAIFLAALMPVLGFIPFYFQEFSTVADRYLYLAMVGPAVWLACGVARLPNWRTGLGVALLLGVLCTFARRQAGHWTDSIALFDHTIRINPDSVLAHNNLGTLLEEKGQWLEAAYHYNEVLRIAPENMAGHYNYGRLLARLGKFEMAMAEFEQVLRQEPGIPDAQYSLGLVLLRLNRLEESKAHFFQALSLRPGHPDTLAYLGANFRLSGNCPQAVRYYDAALERRPSLGEANFGKGKCLAKEGKTEMAAKYFERAAQQDPAWDAPQKALADLRVSARETQRKNP
jgi:protein O-mannosyl-transferase